MSRQKFLLRIVSFSKKLLSGRYVRHELYPFSCKEFLIFGNQQALLQNTYGIAERAQLKTLFNEYFTTGVFPAFVRTKEPDTLKRLFESIPYKNVMARNKLTG